MAVSKIWPLYQTIGKAVKYICNYEKTNDGTLIKAFKCTERFADYEFSDIASKARKVKNSRIGYHMTISFSPEDEISYEKALELGEKIVDEYTGGNYQYVLSVHTDRKHVHVHCVINSVSFKDFKKLQIENKDLNRLEVITDKICLSNGLSVIDKKSGIKGRKKYEYEKHKGGASYKDKLRDAIDRSVCAAESYDDFLNLMQIEEGYRIKQGKYLSFSSTEQERSIRNRSLGDFYSIEIIKDRITHKEKYADKIKAVCKSNVAVEIQNPEKSENSLPEPEKHFKDFDNEGISFEGRVNKLIDVAQNEKAQKYAAYRKKLNLENIDTYAGMMNFVEKYHLIFKEDFDVAKAELEKRNDTLTNRIRAVYQELNTLEADAKQMEKYLVNLKAHYQYRITDDKDIKYNLSDANKKYESAKYYFRKNGIDPKQVTVSGLHERRKKIEKLKMELDELKETRKDVRKDLRQLNIIQQNNEKILGQSFVKGEGQEKTRIKSAERFDS